MPESKSKRPSEPREVEEVDESSDESFPASDPPSWAMGKRAEPPARAPEEEESDDARAPDSRREAPGGNPKQTPKQAAPKR